MMILRVDKIDTNTSRHKTTTRLEYQQASHFSIFRNVIKLQKWNFCGLSVTLRNYCVIVELIRDVDELKISPPPIYFG